MVRVKATDYDDRKHARKEYVYYFESWKGKNFRGIDIAPVSSHCIGQYAEPLKRPVVDPETGEIIEYEFAGWRDRFYIPWNKKTIDEIIAKSAKSDKTSIRYIVKFTTEDYPTGQGAAIRLQSWKWEDCFNWLNRPREKLLDTSKVPTSNVMSNPVM